MRRYNKPPQKGQYYKIRPGAYGIFIINGKILLTMQNHPKLGVEWQLPGGGIEAGEHPIEALTREAFEETGWRVHVERKLGVWKQFTYMPDYDMHAEKICNIYFGRAIYPLGEPTEEFHRASLMPPELAAELLVHKGDRDFLLDLISR